MQMGGESTTRTPKAKNFVVHSLSPPSSALAARHMHRSALPVVASVHSNQIARGLSELAFFRPKAIAFFALLLACVTPSMAGLCDCTVTPSDVCATVTCFSANVSRECLCSSVFLIIFNCFSKHTYIFFFPRALPCRLALSS